MENHELCIILFSITTINWPFSFFHLYHSSISSILIILKIHQTFSKSHLINRVQLIQKLSSDFLRKRHIKLFVSHFKVLYSYLIIYKTIGLIYVVLMRHTMRLVMPIKNLSSMMKISLQNRYSSPLHQKMLMVSSCMTETN